MNWHTKEITVQNESLLLNTERTIYWPHQNMLLLADMHIGKSAHFRKNGLQMPNSLHQKDLQRLANLLDHFQPKTLMILGDLVHAAPNKEWEDFAALRNTFHNIHFTLIKGNHDRWDEKQQEILGLDEILERTKIGQFLLSHEPLMKEAIGFTNFCGHTHPGVSVKMPFKKQMKFPAFVEGKSELILPAFSLHSGFDTTTRTKKAILHGFHPGGFFEIES